MATKTEETAPAVVEETEEKALTTGVREGLSGQFGDEDIALPLCSLVQPTSKDKGADGNYWFPDGQSYPDLMAVVLEIAATRTLWAEVESGEGIICRSPDRQFGYTEKPGLVADTNEPDEPKFPVCEDCPHFADDQFARGVLCKKGYTMLLYEIERDFPFLFFAKGTAVKPIKQRIVSPTLVRFNQTGKATPWKYAYRWGVRTVQDNFKYHVPDIYIDRELTEEEQAGFAERAGKLRGRAGRQTMEEGTEEPA